MHTSNLFRALVGAVLVAGAGAAVADVSYTEAEKLRASGEVLPVERIVEIVNQTRPGEIDDLELDRDLGRYVYEVEVHDADGREWDLDIDAKTGEVLGNDNDD
jgi:uncharacterized membrane protein YkoI